LCREKSRRLQDITLYQADLQKKFDKNRTNQIQFIQQNPKLFNIKQKEATAYNRLPLLFAI
jgi:hypothetical protein